MTTTMKILYHFATADRLPNCALVFRVHPAAERAVEVLRKVDVVLEGSRDAELSGRMVTGQNLLLQ